MHNTTKQVAIQNGYARLIMRVHGTWEFSVRGWDHEDSSC